MFTGYWGCAVKVTNGNVFEVIPPARPEAWPFEQRPFTLHKVCVLCLMCLL